MSEHVSSKLVENLITSIEGMQRKVDALERKIDTLVKKSQPGMPRREYSSRPRKEYDRPIRSVERSFEEKKEWTSGEGKFYDGRPFGKNKGGMKRGKKPFGKPFKGARGNR